MAAIAAMGPTTAPAIHAWLGLLWSDGELSDVGDQMP